MTHVRGQGCEPKLPTQQQASREAQLAVQFQKEDPGGRYDMSVKPIGQGGMGTIYLGQDRRTDRRVAVKKLSLAKNTDMNALHNEIAMMQVPPLPLALLPRKHRVAVACSSWVRMPASLEMSIQLVVCLSIKLGVCLSGADVQARDGGGVH